MNEMKTIRDLALSIISKDAWTETWEPDHAGGVNVREKIKEIIALSAPKPIEGLDDRVADMCRGWGEDGYDRSDIVDLVKAEIAALSTDAEPVKTPFEIASKHIPEARASLLSRAIRQGLNDYGWKNFGTLPEILMSYIVQAEKAEANAHPQKPRDCGQEGGDLIERRDNIGSAYTRSALSAQAQDVAP